jgi:hypothetical protein
MPKVHRVTDPRLCGAVTVDTGLNTKVTVENLFAAVVGGLDSHTNLGALISLSPQTILVQGIPMIISIMDQGSPDQLGLIQHVTGLPTPAGGSNKVTAYGPLGSLGGGLGTFQSLLGGQFAIPQIGEIMQIGSQVIGQVTRVANQGGGQGVVAMNNMNPATQGSISSGTTITSANTGHTFTFSNYYSS